ncbi:MAG: metallophosphoesterase family protein, partial [Chitinophagaceae bacterium]
MTRIGLLSDTHGTLDSAVFTHFAACDEIWHAGDFGSAEVADQLEKFKPLRGVYGNIDGAEIRSRFPETAIFLCEKVKVVLHH